MPRNFKIGEVLQVLRNNMKMSQHEGLVLFANGKHMLKQGQALSEVYDKFADEDGFLYLQYAEENIYG